MSKKSPPKVAFDVDGTLIKLDDTPNYSVIKMFMLLEDLGCEMYIWSGSGIDWAERWADKLGLKAKIVVKGSFIPDIAFDDMANELEFNLGKVNIGV